MQVCLVRMERIFPAQEPDAHYPERVEYGEKERKDREHRFHGISRVLRQEHGGDGKGETQEHAPRVPHEDPGVGEIIPEKSAERSHEGEADQGQGDITRKSGGGPHEEEPEQRYTAGKAVETVKEIDGVRHADDAEVSKGNAEPAEVHSTQGAIRPDVADQDVSAEDDHSGGSRDPGELYFPSELFPVVYDPDTDQEERRGNIRCHDPSRIGEEQYRKHSGEKRHAAPPGSYLLMDPPLARYIKAPACPCKTDDRRCEDGGEHECNKTRYDEIHKYFLSKSVSDRPPG